MGAMLLILTIAHGATFSVGSSQELAVLLDTYALDDGDTIELTNDLTLPALPDIDLTFQGHGHTLSVYGQEAQSSAITYVDLRLSGYGRIIIQGGARAVMESVDVEYIDLSVDTNGSLDFRNGSYTDTYYLLVYGDLYASNVLFENNFSSYTGGAVDCQRSTCTIENSTFLGNRGNYGGDISITNGELVVTDSFFCDSRADARGGSIDAIATRLVLRGNQFVGATSDEHGFLFVNGNANEGSYLVSEIADNTFLGGRADFGSGLGEIQSDEGYLFRNNIVVDVEGGSRPVLDGGGFLSAHNLYYDTVGDLQVDKTDLEGVDPRFVNRTLDCDEVDLRIRVDSPAIGTADAELDPTGVIGALEVVDVDVDEDGLLDSEELDLGTDPDVADSDGDGMNDGDEVANGRNPLGDDEPTSTSTDTGTTPTTGPGTTDPDTTTDPDEPGRKGVDDDADKLSSAVACGCRTGSGGSMGLLLAPLLWLRRQRRRSSQVTAS